MASNQTEISSILAGYSIILGIVGDILRVPVSEETNGNGTAPCLEDLAVSICKPVTKFSATVGSSDTLSEVMESTFSEDSSTQITAMKKMPSIRWIEAILDIALLAGFISAMGFLVRLAF